MKEFVISEVKAETAVLVGLVTKTQDEAKTKEYLDELEFLADTAGAVTVKRFTQKVISPNQTTYVGKGKLEEIKQYIKEEEEEDREIGMVIFDDELSAKQIRNIEQELQVKILDRTSLILDIFAMRAQTAAAKTQVELAQYRYMLPRLQRLWTHLERQGGGSGSGYVSQGGIVDAGMLYEALAHLHILVEGTDVYLAIEHHAMHVVGLAALHHLRGFSHRDGVPASLPHQHLQVYRIDGYFRPGYGTLYSTSDGIMCGTCRNVCKKKKEQLKISIRY